VCLAVCYSVLQCVAACVLSEHVLFAAGCGCRKYICVCVAVFYSL